MAKPDRKFILDFKMAPGDVSMLSSLVRDVKLVYGDKYLIDVRTNFPAIWRHNPYITKLGRKDKGVEYLRLGYFDFLKQAHNGAKQHFVTAFHSEFEKKTGIRVPCLYPKADFHFSEYEKTHPLIEGRYWIVVNGGKTDMSTKYSPQVVLQDAIGRLRDWGIRWIQEGATKRFCYHPPLDNVFNVIGQTSVRDLMVNILHADGVVCPITFMMHVAGAVDTPCVVLAGGREEPWFEAYVDDYQAFGDQCAPVAIPHRFLHTVGLLSCCKKNGCWKRRTVALHDGQKDQSGKLMDTSLCLDVQKKGKDGQILPHCMSMIQTDHIVEAVMSYYEQGILLPPTWR
jgi:hypothetical protein